MTTLDDSESVLTQSGDPDVGDAQMGVPGQSTEEISRRKHLLLKIKDSLGQEKMPSLAWAFLWLADLDRLEVFASSDVALQRIILDNLEGYRTVQKC
jgi:hypothetical protein